MKHHPNRPERLKALDLELLADVMKERIYASLALLAVLLTLDPSHTTATHAAVVIGGTALSLWLASLVSALIARRMIFGRHDAAQLQKDQQRHSPLLASAVLPLILIGLSSLHVFSLSQAITASIWTILLSLIFWSLASARSMRASKLATLMLASITLLIGLGVVALKALLSH